jgi:Ser/Thr protein kinase RdoA (MazF antagonist)
VGTRPKFGSIDAVHGISTKNQDILSGGRELVFRKIRDFEGKFPGKLRLIHADLHFGNLLWVANQVAVIDFDDCGLGFHVYDLAVSINAFEYLLPHGKSADLSRMKSALIETYAKERGWNKEDEAILPYFVTARRLLLLGWLNSRSDNPKLKRRVKKATAHMVRHLQQEYDLR